MTFRYDDGTELYYFTKVYSGKINVLTSHKNARKYLDIKAWFMPHIPLDSEYSVIKDNLDVKYNRKITDLI